MKVSAEHFEILREAVSAVDLPEYRKAYEEGRYARAEATKDVNVRYRWDLYYFAARNREGGLPDSTNGYNMDHIDTALRRIVPNIKD